MIQLPKCCPCIPLWLGCLINALVLFAVDLLENPLPYDVHCCDSLKAILFVLDRVCNIVHIMGCCSLFVASFVGQSVLVKVFLGTSIVHFVMHPVHLVAKIDVPAIIWEDVVLSVLAAVYGIYIWIVALSFYRQCKQDIFFENETRFSRYTVSQIF
ncbi:uncharacterized protein Dana_GF21126, isoform A [Drosophila ananassae]|uniref:Uncharacterized protein, isoform A n=1 Tax=Drosophila ananassae TaxID=7217 RepID=B3MQT4_DROAN|nr:uncharacterized protein LOC6503815 isoform X4 [Drosophila ananassae]EDV34139.1 uncharacterized protein Dana_GF21126, isoform A [Drosophila ananassae]